MRTLIATLFLMAVALHSHAQGTSAPSTSALAQAQLDYTQRLATATEALVKVRQRIADERAPLIRQQRELETELLKLQNELTVLETGALQASETKKTLNREYESFRKNIAYIQTLAKDSLVTVEQSIAPGEPSSARDTVAQLRARLEGGNPLDTRQATGAIASMLARLQDASGGRVIKGPALVEGSTAIQDGTFLIVGPETLFFPANGGTGGTVRVRESTPLPVVYPLKDWDVTAASTLITGGAGALVLDSSGGKALRLQQTTGTLTEHIHQGGVVAYAIIAVGLVALLLCLIKLRDVHRLSVDEPAKVEPIIRRIAEGNRGEAEAAAKHLKPTTRELFLEAFGWFDRPRDLLEDHLESFITKRRLIAEKRLPLLAVIATAAPLMGLLGTVMGMVKTFALITVFGTGNAAKLSSGISEVLVTTELGLAVAIPSLIVHGILSHRLQKKVAHLERYAFEFALARDSARESALRPVTNE